MKSETAIETRTSTRIFARQMARELSCEEMAEVSGGRPPSSYLPPEGTYCHGVGGYDDC